MKAEEAEEDTEVIDTEAADNTAEAEERNTDTQEQPVMIDLRRFAPKIMT